ncbi:DUF1016 family protein [Candidatus Woesearchaeota archaeon]|nr:DUF1016 family protein [Candidatus Woesearchaeota archaeon]
MKMAGNVKKRKLEGYSGILKDIRYLLERARLQAYKAVDNVRVQTYWQIGERIVREELQHKERADYGKSIIENLAKDIGFTRQMLSRIVQFYREYPIVTALRAQLSWTHYELLINISKKEERQFYENQIIQNGWSTRQLEKQIKNKLYEYAKKKGEVVLKKPMQLALKPEEVFKEVYNFEFLDIKKDFKEIDLKNALLDKLEEFIQELGSDFFIGRREVPILISGNYDKVDLELFHAGLICYVLVEVKTEPFKHSHVSQMYSYLNWYKENKWREGQRLPIGLIICKSKEQETVHYALGDLKKEIFISEYKVKLPSEKEIIKGLR